jgi:hypothetical protein
MCLLPPTPLDIETLKGSDGSYSIPNDCQNEIFLEFTVPPEEGPMCMDTTSLVYVPQNLRGRSSRFVRHRYLQDSLAQFLFMIDAPVMSNQLGDRFYTREASDPELRPSLSFLMQSDAGGEFDGNATFPPGLENITTFPPGDTGNETFIGAPGSFAPCGICEDGASALAPETQLDVPPEFLPSDVPPGEVTCGFVEGICTVGGCSPEICSLISSQPVLEACGGCGAVGDPVALCGVCAEGQQLTNTEGTIPVPQEILPPNFSADLFCGTLDNLCKGGECSSELCQFLSDGANTEACGCQIAI